MCVSGAQEQSAPLGCLVVRRQRKRSLEQLCRHLRGTTRKRQIRRLVEGCGGLGIRPVGGLSEVPRPLLRVRDDAGDAPVQPSAVGVFDARNKSGGEQWMGENDPAGVDLDHACVDRRSQVWLFAEHRGDDVDGRLREECDDLKSMFGLVGELGHTGGYERPQVLRNQERLTQLHSPIAACESACELERVQGVASRRAEDTAE